MVDQKYELRALKYLKGKFISKSYDAINRKSSNIEIQIPEDIIGMATRFFSYVSTGKDFILCGGHYGDDKTCSWETYRVSPENGDK